MSNGDAAGESSQSDQLINGVSFILPALNESEHIERSVLSVQRHAVRWLREIVVVDNGSVDGTPDIAKHAGARVINFPDGTVAAARNRGVDECSGDVLVFLDADVSLTPEWEAAFPAVLEELLHTPELVTGSRCATEARNDFLTRFWFGRLTHVDARYVNSGHLITSRVLFDSIDGFDSRRETAEDYDFCMRASAAGAQVINRDQLRAIHHDYPSKPAKFIAREAWHGRDDFKDLKSLRASRVGLVVCLNLLMLLLGLVTALMTGSVAPLLLYLAFAATLAIALTLVKFGWSNFTEVLGTSAVFALYLSGRTGSLLHMLRKRVLAPQTNNSR